MILLPQLKTHTQVFTDASKSTSNDAVGATIYIPVKNQLLQFRLTDNISSYTAELIAIQ